MRLPGCDHLTQHRHVATRLGEVQLVHQPLGSAVFVVNQAVVNRSL